MVYQDRLEPYLLQLFAHAETSDYFFYNLSVVIFEVNIVAEQKQALLVTIFCFLKVFIAFNSFHCTLPYHCSSVPGKKCKIVRSGLPFVPDVGLKVKLLEFKSLQVILVQYYRK